MGTKTTKKPLDWLAEQACAVLEESCGKDYADSKRHRLAGEPRFKVLVWLNELDHSNPAEALNITRETARCL